MKKPATIKDIASEIGISNQAVSAVLNHKSYCRVSPQKRELIFQTARKLGYVRNSLARSMASGKSQVIAMVLFDSGITFEFNQKILCGCLDVANDHNYSLQIYNVKEENQEQSLTKILSNRPAGILIHHRSFKVLVPWLEKLHQYHIPCGVFNLKNEGTIGFGVSCRDYQGTYDAVTYLHSLGHDKIAHVTIKDQPAPFQSIRLQGYQDAIRDCNLAYDRVFWGVSLGLTSNFTGLKELLNPLKPDAPTAVVTATDYLAQEVFRAAYDLNLKIPQQLSLIGFGGLDSVQSAAVSITTVKQPFHEIGAMSMNMLLDEIMNGTCHDGENIYLDVKLNVCESCAKPRSNDAF